MKGSFVIPFVGWLPRTSLLVFGSLGIPVLYNLPRIFTCHPAVSPLFFLPIILFLLQLFCLPIIVHENTDKKWKHWISWRWLTDIIYIEYNKSHFIANSCYLTFLLILPFYWSRKHLRRHFEKKAFSSGSVGNRSWRHLKIRDHPWPPPEMVNLQ